MFQFRKSTLQDMDQIVRIAEEGRALLKSRGISQWQTGSYPDRPLFEQDVQEGIGYVVCEEGRVAAICALQTTPEEDYRHLTEGRWLTGEGIFYAAVHRAAVAPECQGRHVTTFLFDSAAKTAKEMGAASLRADTHPDNIPMQKSLERAGFKKCGWFVISEGDEAGGIRLAYERLL